MADFIIHRRRSRLGTYKKNVLNHSAVENTVELNNEELPLPPSDIMETSDKLKVQRPSALDLIKTTTVINEKEDTFKKPQWNPTSIYGMNSPVEPTLKSENMKNLPEFQKFFGLKSPQEPTLLSQGGKACPAFSLVERQECKKPGLVRSLFAEDNNEDTMECKPFSPEPSVLSEEKAEGKIAENNTDVSNISGITSIGDNTAMFEETMSESKAFEETMSESMGFEETLKETTTNTTLGEMMNRTEMVLNSIALGEAGCQDEMRPEYQCKFVTAKQLALPEEMFHERVVGTKSVGLLEELFPATRKSELFRSKQSRVAEFGKNIVTKDCPKGGRRSMVLETVRVYEKKAMPKRKSMVAETALASKTITSLPPKVTLPAKAMAMNDVQMMKNSVISKLMKMLDILVENNERCVWKCRRLETQLKEERHRLEDCLKRNDEARAEAKEQVDMVKTQGEALRNFKALLVKELDLPEEKVDVKFVKTGNKKNSKLESISEENQMSENQAETKTIFGGFQRDLSYLKTPRAVTNGLPRKNLLTPHSMSFRIQEQIQTLLH